MVTITCHGQLPGAYSYHGGNQNSTHSRPLDPVLPALAADPLQASPTINPDPSTPHISHISPLRINSPVPPGVHGDAKIPSGVEVTEITVATTTPCKPIGLDLIPDEPWDEMVECVEHPTQSLGSTCMTTTPPLSPRIPKRKRTVSPSSHPSKPPSDHRRSASCNTRRSAPSSRRSSLHSHSRIPTSTSLTPGSTVPNSPESQRQSLLALHRESCRLFHNPDPQQQQQQQQQPLVVLPSKPLSPPPSTPQSPTRFSSETPASAVHPGRFSHEPTPSRPAAQRAGPPIRAYSMPARPHHLDGVEKNPSTTVIDWTTPSTRRREYEKIDRASSGVRGLWRRVAPRWCRSNEARMPFFEVKDGKANYEGSVRRFRMDIPEEGGSGRKMGGKIKRRLGVRR